jgi:hypothetical protein
MTTAVCLGWCWKNDFSGGWVTADQEKQQNIIAKKMYLISK